MSADDIDRAAVERLLYEFTVAIRDHYSRRPTARSTAEEVLNSLACTVAITLIGARDSGKAAEAAEFFMTALAQQLEQPIDVHTEGRLQ